MPDQLRLRLLGNRAVKITVLLSLVLLTARSQLLAVFKPYTDHSVSTNRTNPMQTFYSVQKEEDLIRSSFISPTDGLTYEAAPLIWEPLGDRLAILNIDSRGFEKWWKGGRVLTLSYNCVAVYLNQIYAAQHGYKYKFIRALELDDRSATWVKIPQIFDALNEHEFVVLLDSDAYFPIPEIPLEWMMNRWRFLKESVVMLALDPDLEVNYDKNGQLNLNTGFLLLRRSPRAFEMLYNLTKCPEKLAGCENTTFEWTYDQKAFNDFIKEQLEVGTELIKIPCNEGNGYGTHDCNGTFVRHAWGAKVDLPMYMLELLVYQTIRAVDKFGDIDPNQEFTPLPDK